MTISLKRALPLAESCVLSEFIWQSVWNVHSHWLRAVCYQSLYDNQFETCTPIGWELCVIRVYMTISLKRALPLAESCVLLFETCTPIGWELCVIIIVYMTISLKRALPLAESCVLLSEFIWQSVWNMHSHWMRAVCYYQSLYDNQFETCTPIGWELCVIIIVYMTISLKRALPLAEMCVIIRVYMTISLKHALPLDESCVLLSEFIWQSLWNMHSHFMRAVCYYQSLYDNQFETCIPIGWQLCVIRVYMTISLKRAFPLDESCVLSEFIWQSVWNVHSHWLRAVCYQSLYDNQFEMCTPIGWELCVIRVYMTISLKRALPLAESCVLSEFIWQSVWNMHSHWMRAVCYYQSLYNNQFETCTPILWELCVIIRVYMIISLKRAFPLADSCVLSEFIWQSVWNVHSHWLRAVCYQSLYDNQFETCTPIGWELCVIIRVYMTISLKHALPLDESCVLLSEFIWQSLWNMHSHFMRAVCYYQSLYDNQFETCIPIGWQLCVIRVYMTISLKRAFPLDESCVLSEFIWQSVWNVHSHWLRAVCYQSLYDNQFEMCTPIGWELCVIRVYMTISLKHALPLDESCVLLSEFI